MLFLKRPSPEELFEYISIPQELTVWRRARLSLHIRFDSKLRAQVEKLRETWASYFKPEPDVMDSVMRVYSKLRSDETVILKGWKLCHAKAVARPQRDFSLGHLIATTGVAAAVGAIVLWVGQRSTGPAVDFVAAEEGGLKNVEMLSAPFQIKKQELPLGRIRVQDQNSIRVHYMQPELIQSVEFETTGAR